MSDASDTPPLLQVRDIEKAFPGVRALSGVSFEVAAGEVHALLGENGAGKSTLIKILSGVYQPDGGAILHRWARGSLRHARRRQARRRGDDLSGTAALSGTDRRREHLPRPCALAGGGRIDWRTMRTKAEALLGSLEIDDLAADQIVGALSVGNRQRVEILRALSHDARILIMDEPTAALTESDVTRLFDIVRRLKSRGVGIVYISHRLDEIFQIADRVTVLRDGAYVGWRPVAETNSAELVQMMVGRRIDNLFPKTAVPIGAPVLEARDIVRRPMTKSVSLTVRAGEIVGLAGLVGSGRSELAADDLRRHAGRRRARSGSPGETVAIDSPESARAGNRLCAGGSRRAGPGAADERAAQSLARGASARSRGAGFIDRAAEWRWRRTRFSASASRRARSTRSPDNSPAATSRKSCSASGSPTTRSCSSSTSRRAASTSAPRPRSTA